LLLFGDLLEEVAVKLSKDSNNRLTRREMAASGAPVHSYYLNFVSLDRYRKLGIIFLFNSSTRSFHYDGASWREIVEKYSGTNEAQEAQKRLDSLREKMAATAPAR
jgi:chromosome condensin MukBEF MukE localization factor